jgi:diaminopropionate ammonia-lyase
VTSRIVWNQAAESFRSAAGGLRALDFHRRLPGYRPTPLRQLDGLARQFGIGSLLVKDESDRFGLPAFKILGASFAVYRTLVERMGEEPQWADFADLRRIFAVLGDLVLATASDGNHGRAVARVASWLGFAARVYLPAHTATVRIKAIEREGAEVVLVDGSYDDAVARAAREVDGRTLLAQDTVVAGQESFAALVVEGYSTMLHEIDAELTAKGEPTVDLVLVPVGVGSLASAVILHYRQRGRERPSRVVGVEPRDADCARRSLAAGRSVFVPGPHRSVMAGLNCGELSKAAWPLIRDGLAAAIAVDDAEALAAKQILLQRGVLAGESGAASLAGLRPLLADEEARRRLSLDATSRILLLSTEGETAHRVESQRRA